MTYDGNLHSPKGPSAYDPALELLEFPLILRRLADCATFEPARVLALSLLPSSDPEIVLMGQEETAEARLLLERGSEPDLSNAVEVGQALERAALGGVLSGAELRDLGATLRAARQARYSLHRQHDAPRLRAMTQEMPVMEDLERDIAKTVGSLGEVLDGASPLLGELRQQTRAAHQRLMDSMERAKRRLERQGILQEPIITQRNNRMVLLVKTEMKHRLNGIVHDVSDSGATLFMEPMASVPLGNQWREFQLAQEREEERILTTLSIQVEYVADDIQLASDLLARLDLALAKGRYAIRLKGVPVTLAASGEDTPHQLKLVDARHPLLEGEVVPLTVQLGDSWSLLLITGPNAGGKTVALKTMGLLVLMAQTGLQVPAREAHTSMFDCVFVDIGDQQSIQRSLSTFSSHITNLKSIMEQATHRSLVLIDELGSSTDPEEGAALAKAILLSFFDKGARVVATTHQRDVAAFVQEHDGMANASVELDPQTLAPTYKLTVGLPGSSYALAIAGRLGLEDTTVEQARSFLGPIHRETEGILKELHEERRLAAQLSKDAEKALHEATEKQAQLDEKLANLQNSEATMLEEARFRLRRQVDEVASKLRGVEKALERRLVQPPVSVSTPDEQSVSEPDDPVPEFEETSRIIQEVRAELDAPTWEPPATPRGHWIGSLKPGDRVYVKGVPQPVEALNPPEGDTIEVLLGSMRARLPVHQLDRPAQSKTGPAVSVRYSRPQRTTVERELVLRGMRVEEASARVDGFLDDATLAGLSTVRILHGAGSGALRSAIRELLVGHPLVKSFGPDPELRTDSVTVIELN